MNSGSATVVKPSAEHVLGVYSNLRAFDYYYKIIYGRVGIVVVI